MNILIINTWYYPNLMGGAEHSVMLLAEALVSSGHNVTVLTCDAQKDDVTEVINGVNIYRLNARKYNLYNAYFNKKIGFPKKIVNKYYEIFNKSIQPEIERVLLDVRPDVVNVNCFSGLSFYVFETVSNMNIPIVFTIRNFFITYPTANPKIKVSFLRYVIKKIYIKTTSKYLKKVCAITAPSEFTLNKVNEEGLFCNISKKCIPNCVDKPLPEIEIELHNRKYNHESKKTIFLFAGWISEDKGIRNLLNAFDRLESNNYELQICGSGSLEYLVKEYENKYDYVHYNGKLTKEELGNMYRKCDVLVAPSLCEETFGRGIIEAASYGLPVICSDRGAMPEVVDYIKNGLIYKADNIDMLARTIRVMLDKETRDSFCENISNKMYRYSLENQIEEYIKIYKIIASGR